MPAPSSDTPSLVLCRCESDEYTRMTHIINAAAEAYRGVIPSSCWHEPYMSQAELEADIGEGVDFLGAVADGALVGVMGLQPVRDVDLIRHAYVLPAYQGRGIGAALIADLRRRSGRPMLVGTWAAADWAIRFYRRHGFEPVSTAVAARLLRRYWNIPHRQLKNSVVLKAMPRIPSTTDNA